ncbi:MAG: ribonuclease H-like domain-containing protein [Chloroflexi bacterium]|nr:ribonuclease H-like domain-containing protein [Chloroflexota bacterium]
MRLAEELARLGYHRGSASPQPRRSSEALEQHLHGVWQTTPFGECFVVSQTFLLDTHPRLREARDLPLDTFIRQAADSTPLNKAAFLDVETTGLAGGTGTYIFLVGIGTYEGDHFYVRQYFMPDYDREAALLLAVADALRSQPVIATFNGKTFDLPLLETRYLLSGSRSPTVRMAHLDLLPPARRLWRARLGRCGLSDLEAHILSIDRSQDVPSWSIPGLYFAYIKSGDPTPLPGIFQHNCQDVLSLPLLAGKIAGLLLRSPSAPTPPLDLYSAGRVHEEAGRWQAAISCYESALAREATTSLRGQLLQRLGRQYKRIGQWAEAVAAWQQTVGTGGREGIGALVELAKYYEHRVRDFQRALMSAQEALDNLLASEGPPSGQRAALEHRLQRLRRRTAQQRMELFLSNA